MPSNTQVLTSPFPFSIGKFSPFNHSHSLSLLSLPLSLSPFLSLILSITHSLSLSLASFLSVPFFSLSNSLSLSSLSLPPFLFFVFFCITIYISANKVLLWKEILHFNFPQILVKWNLSRKSNCRFKEILIIHLFALSLYLIWKRKLYLNKNLILLVIFHKGYSNINVSTIVLNDAIRVCVHSTKQLFMAALNQQEYRLWNSKLVLLLRTLCEIWLLVRMSAYC